MNLHDQILLYLYAHRNDPDGVDVVPVFSEVEYSVLSKRCNELRLSGYIEVRVSFGGASFHTGNRHSHIPASRDIICTITTTGMDHANNKFGGIHKEILHALRDSVSLVDLIPKLRHRTFTDIFLAADDLAKTKRIELNLAYDGDTYHKYDSGETSTEPGVPIILARILLAGIDYLEGRDIKNHTTLMANQINTGSVGGDMSQDNSSRTNEKPKKNWFLRFWKHLGIILGALAVVAYALIKING